MKVGIIWLGCFSGGLRVVVCEDVNAEESVAVVVTRKVGLAR